MYKILRSESFKRLLPRIIAFVLALAVVLGLCGGGLIRMAAGPKLLDGVDLSDPKGDYVSFDASQVIVAFASLSSQSDSGSKTLKTYYLLPVGDAQYIAVLDRKEKNSEALEKAMEQSREFYLGDLTALTPIGELCGTVRTLEDGMLDYMTDCIDNYELPGYEAGQDSASLILPYQVELDRVGFLGERTAMILGAVALVLLVLLIVQLVVLFAGCYQRKVQTLMGEAPEDISEMTQIERVRVGEYILYNQGPGSRALKTADIIWGYALPEPMVVSKYRWPVALYDVEQNMTRIAFMEQKHCEEFLCAIAAKGHPFVKGYTSEYAEKFQHNFEAFQQEAAHKENLEQA